jgi:CHAD domain-containing protein
VTRQKKDPDSPLPIRRHAMQQTATLLRRMAYEAGRAEKSGGPDPVHDLRVSIRRLAQSLRVFGEFFPRGAPKKIRRKLKILMKAASDVRNRDIALELLAETGMPHDGSVIQSISQERREAEKAFRAALKNWSRRNSFRKWRSNLGL